ncbi:MAG TPA: hypothetical protein VFI68_14730 [Anaerolineales bacterium]|nr:hypothetical protein [Anaerolineales bacterium]
MSNTVRPYITKDEPFGPIDSIDIDSKDVEALELLFEPHNWIYKNLRHRPSIIIGRRGSGKTSYLRSVFFDKKYDFYTEIRTARVLSQVTKVIQRMSKEAFFPEMVSELWEMVIWIGVFSEIRKNSLLPSDDLYVVNAYLDMLDIRGRENVDSVLSHLATRLDETMDRNPNGGATEILKEFDRNKFDHVRSVVMQSFEHSKKKFVVLMDSLDDFQLDIDSVSHSLQGLLKLVGSMNKPRDIVDIRFCLPAEVYHRFIKISSNPNKDFRRALKLQWTAAELILIGAQRLKFYLDIYYPDFIKEINPLDVTKRTDALRLFQAVLPERVTNQVGFQEDTMSYILRHTQLLPRHFLMLLNSIFKSYSSNQKSNPFPVSEERITNGIRQVEDLIVGEIFVAFKLIYPTAGETCRRSLPELGHKFSMGDLHRVFTRHGKAVFGSDNLFDFQRMLLEIGAIGRVIPGKEKDVYIKGNFEYTISHELVLSQDDELCIHPLFSGIFRGNGRERPVYPYGSVLEDEDYRDNDD